MLLSDLRKKMSAKNRFILNTKISQISWDKWFKIAFELEGDLHEILTWLFSSFMKEYFLLKLLICNCLI